MSEDLFDNINTDEPSKPHVMKHGGFYIAYHVKNFFSNPLKKGRKDLDLLDKTRLLLETDVANNNDIMDKCEQFIELHRIVENTKARRRLEKWASRIIAIYLFVVLGIVVCNYASLEPFNKWGTMSISDPVMITILSTTTVNIIGLGLIVLRGHFLMNDLKHDKGKTKSKEPYK